MSVYKKNSACRVSDKNRTDEPAHDELTVQMCLVQICSKGLELFVMVISAITALCDWLLWVKRVACHQKVNGLLNLAASSLNGSAKNDGHSPTFLQVV